MNGNGTYYACGDTCPNASYWTCTLQRDHYGPHRAKGIGPEPLAQWDQEPADQDEREAA